MSQPFIPEDLIRPFQDALDVVEFELREVSSPTPSVRGWRVDNLTICLRHDGSVDVTGHWHGDVTALEPLIGALQDAVAVYTRTTDSEGGASWPAE